MPIDASQAQAMEPNDYRLIDLDQYTNDTFTLLGYKLSKVLDNIILVQYVDLADETGDTVLRNGIAIPLAHVEKAWRIGKVILAGPTCKHVAVDDYVCFPSDKGIPCSNLDVEGFGILRDSVFLDEARIFGVCKPAVTKKDASKSTNSKKSTSNKRRRSKV
tara:strand:+ start:5961 stop:6443 length:483 start_codon:yes stop_codon:yes gene_type:complete